MQLTRPFHSVTGAFPTAAAANVMFLHILTMPAILAKLRAELAEAASLGNISSPIRNSEALKLPYLQACISESLRLYPPITQLRERVTPSGGDTICGHDIPGGVNVGFNAWSLQLHPCFGSNPKVFRPERWLDVEDARLADMRKISSLVFGYGSTKCLGIPQASLILNKIVVEVSCAIPSDCLWCTFNYY